MKVWQADLFHFSSSPQGENQWLLLICDNVGTVIYEAQCPQSEVNGEWLTIQLQQAIKNTVPHKIQIFRPQIIGLFTIATEQLHITLETTRRITAINRKYQFQNHSAENSSCWLCSRQRVSHPRRD